MLAVGRGCAGAVGRAWAQTGQPDVAAPVRPVRGWGLGEAGREPSNGLSRVAKAASALLEAQAVSQLHLLCVGREAQPNPGPDAGRGAPRCLVRADASGWRTPAAPATPRWSTEPLPAARCCEGARPPSLRTCFPRLVPLHSGPESQDRWPARALVRGGEGQHQGRRVRGESGGRGRAAGVTRPGW